MKRTLTVLSLAALLGACATSSPDVISRQDAQRMSSIVDATVLAVRPVVVDGSQSGGGAMAGGVVGGIAGSSVGGHREGAVVGVLAAVAGAMIGNAIERNATKEESLEIMVQLKNGERRSIVQARGSESFNPGDAVIIVTTGSKVRVSRNPAPSPYGNPAPVQGSRG